MLARNGFDPQGMTKGYANRLIDNIIRRSNQRLATPKQAACLARFGYDQAYEVTFEQAKALMNQLAASGWTKRWN